MRPIVDNFVAEHEDVYLVLADMGSFPRCRSECPSRVVDVGPAEGNAMNVALGLALCGRRVFIYGVAGFILYRAWEQWKLYAGKTYVDHPEGLPITFLNGGSGFLYSQCGLGHYVLDDLAHCLLCPRVSVWLPYDGATTRKSLQGAYEKKGPSYIRLAPDSSPDVYDVLTRTQFVPTDTVLDPQDSFECMQGYAFSPSDDVANLSDLDDPEDVREAFAQVSLKPGPSCYVYTMGWLVPRVDEVCAYLNSLPDGNRYKFSCVPITYIDSSVFYSDVEDVDTVVIEDHVVAGGLLNAFDGLSSLALHICVTSEDDIAGDLEEVRHAYGLSYDALNSYLFDLRKQRLEDL